MDKGTFLASGLLLAIALGSCAPAVPYDQMPGSDLYSSANNNRLTADAALQQAAWQEQAMTATAQAPIIHITATAAAMQVQATQAQNTNIAAAQTQAGAMTATAISWTPTPNFDVTSTVAVLNAQSTAIANQVIRDQLQLQREIRNNEWNRLQGALVLLFVASLILIMMINYMRRTRYQAAQTDARGNVLPVIDIVEGMVTDIDRNPNYRGSVSNDILVQILAAIVKRRWGIQMLPEITAERQDATTERDQMIDLATRGLIASPQDARETKKLATQQMIKQTSDSNLASRFKVLDESAGHMDIIDGTIIQALDEEWKEAVNR